MHTDVRGNAPLDLYPDESVTSPAKTGSDPGRPMKSPRPLILDFLLHFCTFGIYSLFWMVARIRELRQLSGYPFTPWLWFFTPIVVLAQPIAFPKMIKRIDEVERARGLEPWGMTAWLWLCLVLVLSVVSIALNWVAVPGWFTTLCLLAWPALCVWLESRFNRIKRTLGDTEVTLKKHRAGYSVLEWLLVVPLVPLVIGLLFLTDVEPLLVEEIETLAPGSAFLGDHGEVSFMVPGDNWSRVVPGAFADEYTLYEFRGPHDYVHMTINHFPESTVDDVIDWRKEMAHEDMSLSTCEERRVLSDRDLTVVVHYSCRGSSAMEPALWTGTVVETAAGTYEMLGYMNIPRFSFRQLEPEIRAMVRGFEVL